MRCLINGMFTFIMLLAFVLLPKVEAAKGTAEVIIFHTNDMHARVNTEDDDGETIGLAEISAAVKAVKEENPNTLWLDAGDTLHGMPAINVSLGENMVLLLNQTSLDAMTPGNHDYNYGAARLQELSKMLKKDVICANTVNINTKKSIFKQYKIYKLPSGVKVGVFGLTTPETKYMTNPINVANVDFLNPVDTAKMMVKKLRSKCDVVIAVMHMGLDKGSTFTSERIANEVDGIDLIVDGHSHTALPEGMQVKNTLIAQTGWHGQRLGCVQINVDNHKITSKSAKLLTEKDVKQLAPAPDSNVEKVLKDINTRNKELFNKVIANIDKDFTSYRLIVRRQESELGNLAADAFKWRTNADFAVMNGGGLRSDLKKGQVKFGDIMALFPFGNNVSVAKIDGKTIHAMLENSVSRYPSSFGGFLDVSGMTFSFDPTQPAGSRVTDIMINGEPIQDSKEYTMASIDFLLVGGDDYDMLKNVKVISELGTCEEILTDYLNQVGTGDTSISRIKMLKSVPMPSEEDENAEQAKEAA